MDETTVSASSGLLLPATSSQQYQLPTETSSIWHAPVVPVGPIVRSLPLHPIPDTQCSATNFSQLSNIPETQSVKCEICQKIFSSQSVCDDHPCAKTILHKCSLCSKTFTRRYNLKIHVEKHFGNFPHRCVVCGSGFTKKSALSKHISKHGIKRSAKLRPQCDICSKVFTRKYTARVHRAKHMENGLWKCPFCPSLFVNTSNLKLHLRKHTNGEHSLVADEGTEDESLDVSIKSSMSPHFQESEGSGQQRYDESEVTEDDEIISASVHPPGHTVEISSDSENVKRAESGGAVSGNNTEDSGTRLTPEPVVLASWPSKQSDSSVSSSNEENCVSLQVDIKRNIKGDQEELTNQQSSNHYMNSGDNATNEVPNTWQTHRGHVGLSGQYSWDELSRKRNNSIGFGSSLRQGISVDAVARLAADTATPVDQLTHNINLSQRSSISNSENTVYRNPQIVSPIYETVPQSNSSFSTDSHASLSVRPVQQKESTHSNVLSQSTSNDARSSWRCGHCCMSFEDGLMFVIHMGCHSQDNPFACNMCGHVSADRLAFMLHFIQGRH